MDASTSAVRAIWADFGGVLTPPIADTFVEFCTRVGVPVELVLDGMISVAEKFGVPLMAPLDLALLTEAEWGNLVADHVERVSGVRHDFAHFSDEWFRDRPTNHEMVAYLRELRERGYLVGMLTNNVREWEPHWRAMLPVDEVFDDVVNSCEVGVRKPDAAIFELAERRFGLAPHQCVLIDDLEENSDGARRRGWEAVTFLDNTSVRDQLEALLSADVDAGKAS